MSRPDAKNALSDLDAGFALVFRSMPDACGIITWPEGRIVEVNDGFERLSGYTREEVEGLLTTEVLWPEREERERFYASLAGGASYREREVTLRKKSGELCTVLASGERVELNGASHFFVIARDVTDAKQVAERLKRSEERYRGFVTLNTQGIARLELDEPLLTEAPVTEQVAHLIRHVYVRECNDAFARLCGRERASDIVGLALGEYRSEALQQAAAAFVRHRHQMVEHEFQMPIAGPARGPWVRISATGAVEDGRLVRVWVILRDVTARKRTEDALQTIAEGISLETGERFFRSLVHSLCDAVGAQKAFVGVFAEDPGQVRTIAVSSHGQPAENFSYSLAGAPCENVVRQGYCCYPSGVRQAFPQDQALVKLRAEGYVGSPLIGAEGRPAGLLVALFEAPIEQPEVAGSVVRTFAVRAGAELNRSRAEQSLRESELRFERLAAAAFEGVAISDQGVFVDANEQFLRMVGYEREDLLGRQVLELVAPVDRERVLARLGRRAEEPMSHLCLRRDGSVFPVEVRSRSLPYGGRQFRVTAVRDITDKVQSELALRASEKQYRDIIDLSPLGFYQSRPDGHFAMANASMAKILGYASADEVLKLDIARDVYFDPADRARSLAEAEKHGVAPADQLQTGQQCLKRKDGAPVWVERHARVIRDASGRMLYLEGFLHDITERKRAEQEQDRLHAEIAQAANEWQRSFDAVDSCLLVLDAEARVVRLNRAARQLLDARWEAVEKGIEGLGDEEPFQTAKQVVAAVQKSGATASAQARDPARRRSWDLTAAWASTSGPAHGRIILAIRDITGIVELQESLRRSETMSAMGSLVAGVAHEVRNPLFSISATLDAMQVELGEQHRYADYWRLLRSQVARLTQLMRDLLDYGKPLTLRTSPIQIRDVFGRSVRACSVLARQAEVKLTENVESDLPPVGLDAARMEQVFENLIANAIQHSPKGSQVEISARLVRQAATATLECSVEDRGPGISVEDAARVFEPFFSRRKGGTGLGLSIVQRIVEGHSGAVAAANRPGGGAVFTVLLPVAREAGKAHA